MNYKGKLYGCVNGAYFPLEMTSEDVDKLESQLTWRSAEESPVVEDTYFVILYDLETRREYPTTAWYEAESGWSFYLPEDHCRVLKWMPIPIQRKEMSNERIR